MRVSPTPAKANTLQEVTARLDQLEGLLAKYQTGTLEQQAHPVPSTSQEIDGIFGAFTSTEGFLTSTNLPPLHGVSPDGRRVCPHRPVATPAEENHELEGEAPIIPQPENIHQVVTYICLGDGHSRGRRLLLLLIVSMMVLLQMGATIAISISVQSPTCTSGSDCPTGRYCGSPTSSSTTQGICLSCVQPSGGCSSVYNANPTNGQFFTASPEAACGSQCATQTPVDSDTAPHPYMLYEYTPEMRALCESTSVISRADTIASIFVLLVFGFVMASECEELTICEAARSQLMDANESTGPCLVTFCNAVLVVVSSIRQHAIMPLIVTQIPDLIAYRGSAALDQAMNGLALLFILEVDNLAYSMLGQVKTDFEDTVKPLELPLKEQRSIDLLKFVVVALGPLVTFTSLQGFCWMADADIADMNYVTYAWRFGGCSVVLLAGSAMCRVWIKLSTSADDKSGPQRKDWHVQLLRFLIGFLMMTAAFELMQAPSNSTLWNYVISSNHNLAGAPPTLAPTTSAPSAAPTAGCQYDCSPCSECTDRLECASTCSNTGCFWNSEEFECK